VWCGTPGESNRGVRALARAESIVSKASQPASTPHEPPTKWNLATSLLAPPPGSSRRCPICSRGNLLPLLFLSLDGRSAPDFGVPLLTESEPARRQFGPRSGGEAKAEAPSASSTALLLTFWKPQRTAVYGWVWVWVCAERRVDALRLRSRSRRSIRRRCCFRLGRGARAVVPPAVALGGDRRRGVSDRMEED
jgi:hypothetical protein